MGAAVSARLAALKIADPPERWRALGFTVDAQDRVALGGVELELGLTGEGITGWALTGVDVTGNIDGLPTTAASAAPAAATQHDNGATGIDHVVIVTGDFERTSAALAANAMPLRLVRESDGHRQGFRRLGAAIMEIVEVPDLDGAARFWGLVVVVKDLHELHQRLDPHLHEIRAAVQPGRRIATLDSSAGLSPRVAFMDPE
jgi:hypothetical protein